MMRTLRDITPQLRTKVYVEIQVFKIRSISSVQSSELLSWATHEVGYTPTSELVNSCFLMVSPETYIGKVVIDGHYFGSIECPWSYEVNLV